MNCQRSSWFGQETDWVESCTALVENERGRLELIHWGQRTEAAPALAEPLRDAA